MNQQLLLTYLLEKPHPVEWSAEAGAPVCMETFPEVARLFSSLQQSISFSSFFPIFYLSVGVFSAFPCQGWKFFVISWIFSKTAVFHLDSLNRLLYRGCCHAAFLGCFLGSVIYRSWFWLLPCTLSTVLPLIPFDFFTAFISIRFFRLLLYDCLENFLWFLWFRPGQHLKLVSWVSLQGTGYSL